MKFITVQIDVDGKKDLSLPVPIPPQDLTKRIYYALASFGGIASARSVHVFFPNIPFSQFNRKLKSRRTIQSLGGGYYALRGIPVLPLQEWFIRLLCHKEPLSEEACLQEIMNYYPHGDTIAIRSWLRQRPVGSIRIRNFFYASPRKESNNAVSRKTLD
ncbi:MAG: hypothetical protein VX278_23845 [Myxococcota bacterium]|nr:hypothetical protein [Myxococcota bacterium]